MQSGSDRDRTVERLLRQSLKARAGSVSRGPCLEAETLAAWADGALAGQELAAAEAHASDCSRCQAMLAAIARDEGARSSGASGPAHEAWWRSDWRLGWLVPLTAAAAALVLWIAVPRHDDRRSTEGTPAQARAAAPSSPEAPESQQNESPALARQPESTLEAVNLRARADERRDQARSKAERSDLVPKDAMRAEAAKSLEKEVDRDRKALDTGQRAADAITSSPGVSPPKQPPASAAEASLKERPADVAGRRAQAAAAAPPTAVLRGAASANAVAPAARESVMIADVSASPVEILSPDRSRRWRPGAAGAVQYSSDGGATWQTLATGVSADLTAGASPSASVCWLVGRAGTVLLSTDGRRWQRATFPEAVDLTAITAIDARTATVTTTDGRRFSTADGGLTWRQL